MRLPDLWLHICSFIVVLLRMASRVFFSVCFVCLYVCVFLCCLRGVINKYIAIA